MGDDHRNDDRAEPGSRRQRITIGVEKVLYLAATDANFRAVLRRDRREALRQWSLTLSSTEKAVLCTVDQRNLDAMIAASRPASEKRRRFMAAVGGAVAASASGLIITASYGCTKGVRPKPSEQPQPRPVTDAGSSKPHTNNPNVDEGTAKRKVTNPSVVRFCNQEISAGATGVECAGSIEPIRDLSPLTKLPKLKNLNLKRTNVTDLTHLNKLTRLEFLNLEGSGIKDLKLLQKLTRLKELYLAGTKVANLSALAAHTQLEYLDLSSTAITTLAPLSKLTKLQRLNVADTRVSKSQVAAIKKALPKLTVLQ